MKTNIRTSFVLFLSLLLFSCDDDIKHEYTINEPIYMSTAEFKSAVKSEVSRNMEETGKIYFYGDYILVNEKFKGIHIINNTDPSNPVSEKFITIPGNIDMAVKDNMLYADSYTDLVVIDISDMNNISETKRFDDVFYYSLPPTNNNYRYSDIDPDKGIVVGWEVKRTSEKYQEPRFYPIYKYMANSFADSSSKNSGSNIGKAGSMARFMIIANTLYTLKSSNALNIYDISNPNEATLNGNLHLGWGIETIFAHNNHLFFGAQQGMYIYDISNPFAPKYVSEYSHFMSCDPVVVDDEYAYITLRSGNWCGQNNSQLDVVDITNLNAPSLLKSYNMENPYGLGIDGDLLFVCDGSAGLKIYDKSDPLSIATNHLTTFTEITPYDVIPLGEILVVISPEGLHQYDYSDINNIQLLSSIVIQSKD
ncbi:LVIVD repeat-containing protein [Marinifilum sp.]|uniref:LVIVD repeat-containing protein n=1 Tax=Marinifilum sp. TaxID=2033137 RepID=UPI003BABCF9F